MPKTILNFNKIDLAKQKINASNPILEQVINFRKHHNMVLLKRCNVSLFSSHLRCPLARSSGGELIYGYYLYHNLNLKYAFMTRAKKKYRVLI